MLLVIDWKRVPAVAAAAAAGLKSNIIFLLQTFIDAKHSLVFAVGVHMKQYSEASQKTHLLFAPQAYKHVALERLVRVEISTYVHRDWVKILSSLVFHGRS